MEAKEQGGRWNNSLADNMDEMALQRVVKSFRVTCTAHLGHPTFFSLQTKKTISANILILGLPLV
jgi:hypothetical protein